MCGIAGQLRFDHAPANVDQLQPVLDILGPRGPDGSGVFAQGSLAFGHRRLKVIDLSDHAAQPMVDNGLGLAIVFNGCIYNYPELRRELEGKGYHFFSHGDTEVILKAYHAWGEGCVHRLSGMFAFAIWERDSKRVMLARDRLGIKPLYLARTSDSLWFASTLPALLSLPDVDTSLNPVALNTYMSFHSIVPPPHTILKGIEKLPPATVMHVEADGTTRTETYWELSYQRSEEDDRRSEEEWTDRVEEALKLAVKRRLVSDVPVGVLLSGGLDSSLVVGLLSELGQTGISTFSVGFENVAEEDGNEFRYSDIIARRYGTDHHRIHVDHKDLQAHLSDCIRAMSEPMVSHDVIGFYLLSQKVSQHVKVVQSGQGADEVFAGYHWYPPLMQVNNSDAVDAYARVFFDRDFEDYKRLVHPDYVQEDYARHFVTEHFAKPNIEDPVDRALRLDTQVMLVDDPVKRVDNMTMAFGLEARVPFLDHDLVELAAKIPARHKVKEGGKHILKQVGRRIIPHEVIDRPKGYFPVPALKYLQGDYLNMAREILSSPKAQARNLFQQDYVERLFEAPQEHLTPLRGSKLWQLVLLEYWLQEQGL
jgi:asparagine synthase (glutamine-hydrolysing)